MGQTHLFPCPHSICTHPFPKANSVCALMPTCTQSNIHIGISSCLSNSSEEKTNKQSTKTDLRSRHRVHTLSYLIITDGRTKRHEAGFLEVDFIMILWLLFLWKVTEIEILLGNSPVSKHFR